jgi:NADH-quinone oxidoreductase subunit J
MTVHDTLFLFFSIAMLLSGVLVIANRNPVASALSLVALFVFLAGLFLLLEAFFLAAIQILVYAGAVMVLFLFVIMLLDIKGSSQRKFRWLSLLGGVAVAATLVWEFGLILSRPLPTMSPGGADLCGRLETVINPLFIRYMLPFEVTGLLLLAAIVGVVLLSRREIK